MVNPKLLQTQFSTNATWLVFVKLSSNVGHRFILINKTGVKLPTSQSELRTGRRHQSKS